MMYGFFCICTPGGWRNGRNGQAHVFALASMMWIAKMCPAWMHMSFNTLEHEGIIPTCTLPLVPHHSSTGLHRIPHGICGSGSLFPNTCAYPKRIRGSFTNLKANTRGLTKCMLMKCKGEMGIRGVQWSGEKDQSMYYCVCMYVFYLRSPGSESGPVYLEAISFLALVTASFTHYDPSPSVLIRSFRSFCRLPIPMGISLIHLSTLPLSLGSTGFECVCEESSDQPFGSLLLLLSFGRHAHTNLQASKQTNQKKKTKQSEAPLHSLKQTNKSTKSDGHSVIGRTIHKH